MAWCSTKPKILWRGITPPARHDPYHMGLSYDTYGSELSTSFQQKRLSIKSSRGQKWLDQRHKAPWSHKEQVSFEMHHTKNKAGSVQHGTLFSYIQKRVIDQFPVNEALHQVEQAKMSQSMGTWHTGRVKSKFHWKGDTQGTRHDRYHMGLSFDTYGSELSTSFQ